MSRFASHAAVRPRTLSALALGALTTAALLGSPAIAATAQPAAEAPQTIVYYSSRDLASDQGTRALYERIVSAARTVCPESDSRDLAAFAASRECQREAVSRAIHQIGSARLAAVYSGSVPKHG
ncbi:MAG TPA: UrcA family protein [Steroidobacteraceae bacterium]